ncbi:hypothetical protein ABIA35_001351 [Catenulispora sp. MAP12-49]
MPDGIFDLGVGVVEVVVAGYADAEPRQVRAGGRPVVHGGCGQGGGVPVVVSGQGSQDEGRVLDGSGDRADVVQ